MSRLKKNPGLVPNRWMHCPRKSDSLIIDKFLALKTPLSNNFDEQVPPECRFPPKMLFDYCKSKKVMATVLGLNIYFVKTTFF